MINGLDQHTSLLPRVVRIVHASSSACSPPQTVFVIRPTSMPFTGQDTVMASFIPPTTVATGTVSSMGCVLIFVISTKSLIPVVPQGVVDVSMESTNSQAIAVCWSNSEFFVVCVIFASLVIFKLNSQFEMMCTC